MRPIVAVHHELVGSGHETEAVAVIELTGNVLTKGKARAAGRNAPAGPIVRVTPQQIAHGALVRDLLDAIELPDVIQRVDGRGEAAVETKDAVLDECRERKVVKEVREELPDVGRAILSDALVVKSVDLGDLSALVVASQNVNPVRISDFPTNQHGHRLDAVISSVDVVPHEEVVGIGRVSSNAKELHQIMPLTVNVSADRDGRRHWLDVRLLQERLSGEIGQLLHFRFRQRRSIGQFREPAVHFRVIAAADAAGR